MTAQPDFKIPSWVPKSVQETGLQLLPQAKDEKARAVLKRLLTDRRMRRVWTELTKQKRNLLTYKPTGHFYKQDLPSFKFLSFEVTRNTLQSFFSMAYLAAAAPVPPLTKEEVIEKRSKFDSTARQLSEIATRLQHWNRQPEVVRFFEMLQWLSKLPRNSSSNLVFLHPWTDLDEFAGELVKLARFFDFLTGELKGHGLIVQRHTARDDVRVYVHELAGTCRYLFGSSLYSVIATTASVALKTKVKPAFAKRSIQSVYLAR